MPDQGQIARTSSRDWLIIAIVDVLAVFLVGGILARQWVMEAVGRWAILAGVAVFYELRVLKKLLPALPGNDSALTGPAAFGQWLVMASGLFYALLAGFLLVTQPIAGLGWLPVLLALLGAGALFGAGMTKGAQQDESSPLGMLFAEFRALGTLVVTALAVHYGKIDAWFMLIGAMDYLILFTRGWQERRGGKVHLFAPSSLRLHLQYLYLTLVGIALAPTARRDFVLPLALVVGIAYFLAALRDWFLLAGLLKQGESSKAQVVRAAKQAVQGWLALSIRLLAAMAVATVAADMVFHFDVYAAAFQHDILAGMVILALLVALPFLFLGVRSRWFALLGFGAMAVILLIMGRSPVVDAGVILLGLTVILGQGSLAVEEDLEE